MSGSNWVLTMTSAYESLNVVAERLSAVMCNAMSVDHIKFSEEDENVAVLEVTFDENKLSLSSAELTYLFLKKLTPEEYAQLKNNRVELFVNQLVGTLGGNISYHLFSDDSKRYYQFNHNTISKIDGNRIFLNVEKKQTVTFLSEAECAARINSVML